MRREIAAKRYAEAVFQIARDARTLDQWRSDLQAIAAVFGDAQMLGLLENARVPEQAKLGAVSRTLAGISPLAMNFARLLIERRRVTLAPRVADDFRTLMDAYLGLAHAVVTTAVEVDDNEKQLIAAQLSRLTGKQVDVQLRVDPAILGGMVARVGDRLIDGSARTRLRALRSRLEVAH
jgi:F-type H+-transporting ATPase subunit delta